MQVYKEDWLISPYLSSVIVPSIPQDALPSKVPQRLRYPFSSVFAGSLPLVTNASHYPRDWENEKLVKERQRGKEEEEDDEEEEEELRVETSRRKKEGTREWENERIRKWDNKRIREWENQSMIKF